MTGQLLSLLCFVVATAVVATAARPAGRRSRRRLAQVAPLGSRAGVGRVRLPGWLDRVRLGAGLGAVAVALLVGGWWGLAAGGLVGAAFDRTLRRIEPASARARRSREAAELPLAADLLAVALRGGAAVDRAVAAVADALPGPLGDRLGRVARLLALGAAPAEAWAQVSPVPGGPRLARTAVRSADHGGALSGALLRIADDLRADRAATAEAASRRAGVLIVLPLGLCFLPAFILAGLVPVIVAVLGDVL